jgi:RNA binding exosome subunit
LSHLPVAYINIRFFAYATEDLEKVVNAVQNILPNDSIEGIAFSRTNLEGHYGNPITLFEAKIKDKETIRVLMENLSSNLSTLNKEELSRQTERYIGEGSLYLRLDKQAAIQGKIRLVTSDPIRIRVRFRKSKIEDIIKICREIGVLI